MSTFSSLRLFQRALIAISFVFLSLTSFSAPAKAQSTRPCDIFAAATACVAAFSTTRALYSAYNGPLYQVTRLSDNGSTNVGVNSSGYANAGTQDSFCANTTCNITEVYDQSSNHNHLTLAPPGGNGYGPGPNGQDLPVNAAALPITVGGSKAYGMYFIQGMGYRNDATTGVATGGQAEGVYMVTSGRHFNGGCCFDFGNAEVNNLDNGAGHMDAINIICGSSCSNPAVGLDMENGIYGMTGVGNADTAFVTAMGANDGQSTFAIYEGNAQSGGLNTTGTIPLPGGGYTPMSLEGAIILGIGGDNSITSVGSFFEGVMTRGAPSSSVMNSVQSNIVAAGYSGGCYSIRNSQDGNQLWQTGEQYMGNANVWNLVDVPGAWQGAAGLWDLAYQGNGQYRIFSRGKDGQIYKTGESYGGNNSGNFNVVTVPSAWTDNGGLWNIHQTGNGDNYIVNVNNSGVELQETGETYSGASNVFYDAATPTAWGLSAQRWSLTPASCQ